MSRWLLAALLLSPVGASAALCRFVSGNGIAFGSYDLLAAAPRDTQGTVTVSCDGTGRAETVLLSVGIAGTGLRRMLHTGGSTRVLVYELYRDPSRSARWGNVDGVDTLALQVAVPASGSATASIVIYGRIPARQDAAVGTYADSVQVTINY